MTRPVAGKGLKNNSQIISTNRIGKKTMLKSALKNRKKNLQFTNYVMKIQNEKEFHIMIYQVMLTAPKLRVLNASTERLNLLGLLIFDYFDLRELIFLGQVSRVFYDLAGRKEVLNKFFPSTSKK